MNVEYIKQLKLINNAVNETSEHTLKQINSIDSNFYIGGLISLIFSFGLSYVLNITIYWVIASFVIMILSGSGSLLSSLKKHIKNKGVKFDIDESLKIIKEVSQNKYVIMLESYVRNLSPSLKATAIIYSISAIILLLIGSNLLGGYQTVSIIVPFISILVYLPFLLIVEKLPNALKESNKEDSTNFIKDLKNRLGKKGASKLFERIDILFEVITFILYLLMPVWSFVILFSFIDNWFLLIVVIILQLIMHISFASYFSAIQAKKELTSALTNLADINGLINRALIKNLRISKKDIEFVKKMFFSAKRYELFINDSMKFVNFYILLNNRVYLSENI